MSRVDNTLSVEDKHDVPEATTTTTIPPDLPSLTSQNIENGGNDSGLTDQTNYLPRKQILIAFVGLSAALGCAFLDQSIVSTALPNISSELRGGTDSSWVATAYMLTSLAFTPLYGRWSDVFGRKTVLVTSLIVFWAFSLACALAQTMLQLIVFRALKGIGGGALLTMVFIYIGDLIPLAERGKYQSLTEIVSATCNGLGPILGGVFSEVTTWRWCFYINLPICGFAIISTFTLIPSVPVEGNVREKFMKIDYVGSISAILASTLLLLGLTWGGIKYSWTSVPVLVPLMSSFILFGLFLLWEARWAKLPIVPIHVFQNPTLIGSFIGTSLGFMTMFMIIFYIPQLLQLLRGTTPIHAGIMMMAFLLVIPFVVMTHGFIVDRTGRYKPSIVSGFALWTIAQGVATTINKSSSNGLIVGVLVLAAIGSGGTFQTMLIATHAAVPRSEMAVTTGVRNFLRLLASSIGLAVGSALINNTLRASLEHIQMAQDQIRIILDDPTSINRPEESGLILTQAQHDEVLRAYTVAFQRLFYMTVAFCGIATIACQLLLKEFSLEREEEKKMKESAKAKLREMNRRRKEGKAEKDLEKGHVTETS
ncbi:MFS general substrate transporter [Flagelloscypha sp. PMI_526]|nr:MFS general substrate transporter [Flagelloscypha sp. PMI_526]